MSGLEGIALVSFISAVVSLVDFGSKVVQRLNEIRTTASDLPAAFRHIGEQLPLILGTVEELQKPERRCDLSAEDATRLTLTMNALKRDLEKLYRELTKILLPNDAGSWEKLSKAVKSVTVQKTVEDAHERMQSCKSTLLLFMTSRNTALLHSLLGQVAAAKPATEKVALASSKKPLFLVDRHQDEQFLGREALMETLENRFKDESHVSLSGLGGVGKSRIAIEYCYKRRLERPDEHVFWVHGATRASFEASYQNLARALALKIDEDVDRTQRSVYDWLSTKSNGPWFMVIDNADDQNVWLRPNGHALNAQKTLVPLIQFVPSGKCGQILFTTRDKQLGDCLTGNTNKSIAVERFAPDQARSLLLNLLPKSEALAIADATELVKELEYLPLTIKQAAACLEQIEVNVQQYVGMLRSGETVVPELLEESIDDPTRNREGYSSNSIFKTWRLSFELILQQMPRAAELLSLMSLLDRQCISQDIITTDRQTPIQLRAALAKLKAFSLIEQHPDSQSYSLHRLVQLSTQKWMESKSTINRSKRNAIAVVFERLPETADYEHWDSISNVYLHARIVSGYVSEQEQSQLQRATIQHVLGQFELHQGSLADACNNLQSATDIRTKYLGRRNLLSLTSKSLLGVVFSMIWRSQEAHDVQFEVFLDALPSIGTKHPLTLKSMSRRANHFRRQGKPWETYSRHCEVLPLMKKVLGYKHPDTLIEMGNLTFIQLKLGLFKEAQELAAQTLALRSDVYGIRHPDTLTAMSHLAWSAEGLGKFGMAKSYYDYTLALRKEVLGVNHPKTMQTMRIVARYHSQHSQREESHGVKRNAESLYRTNPDTARPAKLGRYLTVTPLPERPRALSTGRISPRAGTNAREFARRVRSTERQSLDMDISDGLGNTPRSSSRA